MVVHAVSTPLPYAHYQRCTQCDMLFRLPVLKRNQSAWCPRCNAKVRDGRDWSLTRLGSMALAMLLLMPFAWSEPLLRLHLLGVRIDANVLQGIWQMTAQGDPLTAAMVLFCAVVAPVLLVVSISYLWLGNVLGMNLRPVLLMLDKLKEWVMLDIYLVGIGVASIKVQDYAFLQPGIGLVAFISLTLLSILTLIHMNVEELWERFYPERPATRADNNLQVCTGCHYTGYRDARGRCRRCHTPLHHRRPQSLQRSWAALIASLVFLLPANLLPISIIYVNGARQEDTILSGIISLASSNIAIAGVVFIASILVPFTKVIVLFTLLLSIQFKCEQGLRTRILLLRLITWIGRWSIAAWLIWTSFDDRGSTITIDFQSANGIVPGRTPIRYQGVEVGTVQDISLSKDLSKIEVSASIKRDMKEALRKDTQFWLVTPKASLAGVSGLDALVGGNYIGMMPGKGEPEDHFVALDTQPKYRINNGELMIHLQAPDLGSLSSGSLVYFRKIPVGRVYDFTLNDNNQGVTIDVLIERRFTNLVKKGSRFWNVSGIKADVGLSGAKVQLENLSALVNGAIAFDSPADSQVASQNDDYHLYEDLAHSQRGVVVTLDLPDGDGLKAGSTPLMYQGLEVGQLSKLNLNPGGKVTGEMTVDPSVVTLLREKTLIQMKKPKISLDNPSVSALLTGNTFELVPGEGEPRNHFSVMPADKALLEEPNVATVTLSAPESYGIDGGQPLVLHGVKVGQVLERKLTAKGVTFQVAIAPEYRDLIRGDSKFVVNSRLDVKVGLDGVQVLGASASEWVNGGIRVIPGEKGEMQSSYPLYANLEKAQENSLSEVPTTTLSLSAETLPDVQAGSVVLYRKFAVGEIIAVKPRKDAFDIDLHIKPEYRYLLTNNSVFWAEGGAKVKLDGNGLTVQASPLARAIKGAISFDNLNGSSANARLNNKRILYASETAARAVGGQITLHAFDAGKMAAGMPIRYLGIDIGQIQSLELITAKNEVQAKAVLYPEYVGTFARAGTRFSVITPQISAAGVEHLDTLFQSYINVEPGRGPARRDFEIQDTTISDSRYIDGLNIVVEAPEAGSLGIGTPVLFRGLEVGTVTGLSLGSMSDRVMVKMRISKRYQYLVRNNSVFWLASGYSLDFGLVGGVVKTGTFNQFIRGGIAFATPPGTPLAPKAQDGKHFLLLESEPKEWREWGTALPQ